MNIQSFSFYKKKPMTILFSYPLIKVGAIRIESDRAAKLKVNRLHKQNVDFILFTPKETASYRKTTIKTTTLMKFRVTRARTQSLPQPNMSIAFPRERKMHLFIFPGRE